MPSLTPITVPQGNDVTVALSVTQADGSPQDLTGLTPVMVVKPSAYAEDTSGTTLGAGTGLSVVSAAAGTLSALLPRTLLAQPVPLWFRLDITNGAGNVTTAIEGPITVLPG